MRKPYSIHMKMYECWSCGGHCNGIIHRCAAKSWKRKFIFSSHLWFLKQVNDPKYTSMFVTCPHPYWRHVGESEEKCWAALKEVILQEQNLYTQCQVSLESTFNTTILECVVNGLYLFLKPMMWISIYVISFDFVIFPCILMVF